MNVCTSDAIRMEWNPDGFLEPSVDFEKCIGCGACVRNCPAQPDHLPKLRNGNLRTEKIIAYGSWNTNKEALLASSSGGVFSALAQPILKAGGCIFGVIWDNKDTAVYTKAESMEELIPMRGAKYIQAIPGIVYRQVKEELRKGRPVLFSGTSCQVYALRQYLRKDYENLLLVDILCHGTPSRYLLQSYIREYENIERKVINHIQFRNKAGNWQHYQVTKVFSDGSTLSHAHEKDAFMRIFIGDCVLNEACYNCPHARFPRVGDVSLGDFWGNLAHTHPDWPMPDGIGAVLGNNKKGKKALESLSETQNAILKRVSLDELIEGQPSTYQRHHETLPPIRRYSLTLLREGRLSALLHYLFECEQCGPFRFRKNGLLHKAYTILRLIKRKLMR